MKISRAATKIVLALEAWKLEHGELPESLDELADAYPGQMPKPSLNDSHFRLFPKGLTSPAVVERSGWDEENTIPSGTPFIWMGVRGPHRYAITGLGKIGLLHKDAKKSNETVRDMDMWNYGIVFPIP